jgi:hypothetical protein
MGKQAIRGTKSLKKRRTIYGGRRSGRKLRKSTPRCSEMTRRKCPIDNPLQTPPSTRTTQRRNCFAGQSRGNHMSASTQRNRPSRGVQRKRTQPTNSLPPIVCARCGGPLVRGQNIGPLFSAQVFIWSAHPVLSSPMILRGVVPTDGSPGRSDLSLGEQLRQRAAMGRREGTRRTGRLRGADREVDCRRPGGAIGTRSKEGEASAEPGRRAISAPRRVDTMC